ncbi:TolC family protein [Pedobacter frigoris]|uniref:TolC family protein n=1 Tax=Pedobacter frigoris TaxID=2571272 RepID=UPI002930546B|nr:TolC family protein [Pedobacter frigoris]
MNYKKATIILFLTLFLFFVRTSNVFAQESLLSEISYLYMEKLVAAAKANHPRVKMLGHQINSAKTDVSSAKISWLDPLSFQYVARSNQANTNAVNITTADILTGYQFGFAINPGALFSKPSQIKKAKEQVKIAESSQAEYFLELEALVKTRYIIFLQAQKLLVPLNDGYNNAKSNFDDVKIKYQKAETTLAEFNSASSALNSSYEAKIQAETNYLSAKIALEELTVTKLENIK